MIVFDILAIVLIAVGLVFFLGGAVGLIRFPDVYTRMHAAGKGDTLSSLLLIGGFCSYQMHEVVDAFGHATWYQPVFVIFKLLGICVFIMFTSPSSTHALIASFREGDGPQGSGTSPEEGGKQP